MRFRKLRIAWSVVWGIVCVLLIALWVRSYWWTQVGSSPLTVKWSMSYGSYPGVIGIGVRPQLSGDDSTPLTMDADDWWLVQQLRGSPAYSSRVFGYFGYGGGVVALPYWFAVFVSATFAGTPWLARLEWRFSLRTILIVTSLVAVALGLIVYLTR
jgi:hypothetical protein